MISDIPSALLPPESSILSTGSILLGGTVLSGRPIAMDEDSVSRHTLVLGTTGSGKTELLLSMSESAIISGGGILFIDGKGDHATRAHLHSMAVRYGREEDSMSINFGRGGSCSWNPLAELTAEDASTFFIASLAAVGVDGAMWQERASSLMRTACMLAWDYAAASAAPPTPALIESFMKLNCLTEALSNPCVSKNSLHSLHAYFDTLPGYQASKGALQAQTTMDQHGYLSMQWTAIMGLLCNTYINVFREPSDVSIRDVMRNRRILYVGLPTMARSAADIRLLGSLVFSALRNAMLDLLPAKSEGEWNEVAAGGVPRGLPPMLCIMDEVGHYLCSGMGVMAAQARSMGVGLVFASQDISSMEEAGRYETALIKSNAGTRIIMRQTNPDSFSLRELLPSEEHSPESRNRKSEYIALQGVLSAQNTLAYLNMKIHEKRGEWTAAGNIHEGEIKELAEKQLELSVDSRNITLEAPEWSLSGILGRLQPGEFIAVQGREYVFGRAVHASAGTLPTRVTLPSLKRFSVIAKTAEDESASELLCLIERCNKVQYLADKNFVTDAGKPPENKEKSDMNTFMRELLK